MTLRQVLTLLLILVLLLLPPLVALVVANHWGWVAVGATPKGAGIIIAFYATWLAALGALAQVIGFSIRDLFRRAPAPPRESAPLRAVTTDDLLARLGHGGQVPYVPRGVTSAELLRAHPAVVITGPMNLGKTREAVQLIRRAVADDLVNEKDIFEPASNLDLLPAGTLRAAALSQLDRRASPLLFVDDLPYHFAGDALDRLGELLDALSACKSYHLVATARQDQLHNNEACRIWLECHAVHTVTLLPLDADQAGTLVDNAAPIFYVAVQEDARAELVAGSDGTAEQIVGGLRGLPEGPRVLDRAAAQRIVATSPARQWRDLRDYIGRLPGGKPLLDTLAIFHAARVRPYAPLVLAYAAQLWSASRPRRPQDALRRTLIALASYGMVAQGGQIHIPDIAVEGLIDPAAARQRLETFLTRHRRLLHRRWLRRFYPDADCHTVALLELAVDALEREDWTTGARLCTSAIRVLPISLGYRGRGIAHRKLGQNQAAIDDYSEAIRLCPAGADKANLYSVRGMERAANGDLAGSIADSACAITLNPQQADAHYATACAHARMHDPDPACTWLEQAIALDPNCRAMARTDTDFDPIRNEPGFQALIAESPNPLGDTQ